MLNSALTDQTVQMGRFTDITGKFNKGTDVITSKAFDISKTVTIPAKGELILELGN